jgi:hypothetical protein
METVNDVLTKRFSQSLVHLMNSSTANGEEKASTARPMRSSTTVTRTPLIGTDDR